MEYVISLRPPPVNGLYFLRSYASTWVYKGTDILLEIRAFLIRTITFALNACVYSKRPQCVNGSWLLTVSGKVRVKMSCSVDV